MHDSELKKLLNETCPVRPGQEARAWAALRDRLYANPAEARRGWFHFLTWRRVTVSLVAIGALVFGGIYLSEGGPEPLLTADSNAPGIFATCFYSNPAHAQVVWLSGLAPVNNSPTYMDPTTVLRSVRKSAPASNPNSL
jgi:hypothetical protein